LAGPSRTIGEAAQREALRRQLTPKAKALLTNLGQPAEIPLGAQVAPPPAEPPPAGAPPTAPPEKDEKWWRARVSTANETLTRDQTMAQNIQSRVNVLQRDVVNVDDPVRQAQLRQELQLTLQELNRTNKLIEEDRKAIQAIQDEARRLNVPAGWIR
jgi:hypothetical protein